MILVGVACALLMIFTTLIHYEALRLTSAVLPRLHMRSRTKPVVVIIAAFVAHVVEIALYAVTIYVLTRWFDVGALGGEGAPSFAATAYFSAETYTSLGYGDVVPHGPLRLLAGAEALNGLLLIGWSASFIFVAMERFWNVEGDEQAERRGRKAKRGTRMRK